MAPPKAGAVEDSRGDAGQLHRPPTGRVAQPMEITDVIALLAASCHVRRREIADMPIELLITSMHRIGAKADERVEGEPIADLGAMAQGCIIRQSPVRDAVRRL